MRAAVLALLLLGAAGCGAESSDAGAPAVENGIAGAWTVDESKLDAALAEALQNEPEAQRQTFRAMLPLLKKGLATTTLVVKDDGTYTETSRNPMTGASSAPGTWKRIGSAWAFQEEDGEPSQVTMKAGQLVRRKDGKTLHFIRQ